MTRKALLPTLERGADTASARPLGAPTM